jgi:hypothetical protein
LHTHTHTTHLHPNHYPNPSATTLFAPPQEIFSKYDKDGKGGLTWNELQEMVKGWVRGLLRPGRDTLCGAMLLHAWMPWTGAACWCWL